MLFARCEKGEVLPGNNQEPNWSGKTYTGERKSYGVWKRISTPKQDFSNQAGSDCEIPRIAELDDRDLANAVDTGLPMGALSQIEAAGYNDGGDYRPRFPRPYPVTP